MKNVIILSGSFLVSMAAYASAPLSFESTPIFPKAVSAGMPDISTYILKSNTNAPLPLRISFDNSAAKVINNGNTCGAQIAAQATCSLPVQFNAPDVNQNINAKMKINTNQQTDLTSDLSFIVAGGKGLSFTAMPNLNTVVRANNSLTLDYSVENTADVAINKLNINATGYSRLTRDNTVTLNCGTTLGAKQRCNIRYIFNAQSLSGIYPISITVAGDNDNGGNISHKSNVELKDRSGFVWQRTNGPYGLNPVKPALTGNTHLAITPTRPNIRYLATEGGGVYKSIDAGINWQPYNNNLPRGVVIGVAASEARIYAVVQSDNQQDTSLYSLYNNGVNWLPASGIIADNKTITDISLVDDKVAVVSLYSNDTSNSAGVYGSNDGGNFG